MVDPISISLGAVATLVTLTASYGLYSLGQSPGYLVDMREVSNYYRRTAAVEALDQDVEDNEDNA